MVNIPVRQKVINVKDSILINMVISFTFCQINRISLLPEAQSDRSSSFTLICSLSLNSVRSLSISAIASSDCSDLLSLNSLPSYPNPISQYKEAQSDLSLLKPV